MTSYTYTLNADTLASYTLDALWTLRDRMDRNGTTGAERDALDAELARRMQGDEPTPEPEDAECWLCKGDGTANGERGLCRACNGGSN